jgi:RHS repeat-associated protein
VYNYTWDAEGRLASANGVTYTYDGDGRRVEKSSGTIYWYDDKGNVIEETDLNGNLVNDYFYAAGMRAWREDSSGGVYTYLSDPLGSVRYVVGPNGTESESDWYPFGGERVISDTLTNPNHYKFTGMERDTETGLDHTLYRQFSSNYGRWYSPDRMVGNVLNPQSWNRYAYVTNNPATFTDPLGLDNADPDCASSYAGCPTNVPDASTDTNQQNYAPESAEMAAGEASYISNNCIGCVEVILSNGDSYIFASFDAYADAATDVAAIQVNQTTADFETVAKQMKLDPNKIYTVDVYMQGLTLNIVIENATLNTSLLPPGTTTDPFLNHGTSYVQWGVFDQSHYVDMSSTNEMGYHNDWFGSLNPAHYADYALGGMTGQYSKATYHCSGSGGCH